MKNGKKPLEPPAKCYLPKGILGDMAVTTCRCPKCKIELTVSIPYREGRE